MANKDLIKELSDQDIPFKLEDITDVRLLIRAKGKTYSILPKDWVCKDNAKAVRKALLLSALAYHDIIIPSLEEQRRVAKKHKPK